MSSLSQDLFFAAVGDVHGDMYAMLRLLQSWESRFRKQLAFVLQVGDFEPHRNAADVATMDAPSKYKKLGHFPDFYSGKSVFPWPIWFIGGNHEPYGFLEQKPEGFEVAKNCHYLGRVGSVVLGKLKIVGVSGIYREDLFYYKTRPDVSQIGSCSNKDYIGFTQDEIAQAIDLKSADILLLHEWPRGVISPVDMAEFQQWRRSLGYDDEVGNDCARMLVEFLKPKLVLCGHMHKRYRNQVSFSPEVVTDICCLANVAQGWDAIAIFQLTPDGNLFEVSEGLALCYPTTDII